MAICAGAAAGWLMSDAVMGQDRAREQQQPFIWIEGEQPAASNVPVQSASATRREFLSEGLWGTIARDADKLADIPGDAVEVRYEFTGSAARHELWARIGFEFARSPFDWRMNGGSWSNVSGDQLTTDLMELDFFTEIAWLKLGDVDVRAGRNTIEFRIPKTKNEKGEPQRLIFALDAICLSIAPFTPNSKFKPGQEWREQIDHDAQANVFELPAPTDASARASVPLKGLWQVARHDEQLPGRTDAPIEDFPSHDIWKGIQVPSNKNTQRPDLLFAHRLWYRTKVDVPASFDGRSFFIEFPQNNLNTTVYVNGVYCGFEKNPFCLFRIDVTKGIKSGQVNEIWVGIKDAWYGYSSSPTDPMKLRRRFNTPERFFAEGFQDLEYPVWQHSQSGILFTPTFVAAGRVYVDDVFVKPSVVRKQLGVETTVRNTTPQPATAEITVQAIDEATGQVVKDFGTALRVALDPDQTVHAAVDKLFWRDAKVWWPDEPNLYHLRTTTRVGGEVVDVKDTLFGFREWTADGKFHKLNGVNWPQWSDLSGGGTPEQFIETYRKHNTRSWRFWGMEWMGMSPDETLTFMDRHGVVVRRSGLLDGQRIGYMAIENSEELKKLFGSEIKMQLMHNWHDQMVAQVKGERNHPSINIWSLENEWLYINCINLYAGQMDEFEREVKRVSDGVMKADPTRLTMTDGGGANKDNAMPIHGNHYVFGDYSKYPDLAYDANVHGGSRGRWVWDQQRPRWLGEDFFANGINPFDYSYFAGEETFQGKLATKNAETIIYRMLTEGYRWADYAGWTLWMGSYDPHAYVSQSPVAALVREWDWTFGGGQTVNRALRIFNHNRHSDPITFTWQLTLGGQRVAGESTQYDIPPGGYQQLELPLTIPASTSRAEGELILTLQQRGKDVFRDVKQVSVLPVERTRLVQQATGLLQQGELLVYDPKGGIGQFIESGAVRSYVNVGDLNELPATGKVLIVGSDALSAQDSASSNLLAWASSGRSVIILEQDNPLRYTALPADLDPQNNEGRTAFPEDLSHPIMKGLATKDFFTWGPDHVIYKNAYGKATRAARSLVQCHERLANTALIEVPAGKGLLLLCQLKVGEKLATNAVAQQLLANMIDYAANYKLEFRDVISAVSSGSQVTKELDAIGLQSTKAADALSAIRHAGQHIAVIEATPANLKQLADNRKLVDDFTAAGGWIFFNGLTPEGLADYNKVVGVDHMIRPFRRERVTFPASRHPLTAGLTTGDIVMESGQRINNFTSDTYLASDVFTHIVDHDEVAPFATLPPPQYFNYTDATNDHDPYNMVNGFVSGDSWQYIFSIAVGTGSPANFDMTFPKEQDLTEIEWIGNGFYHKVEKVELTFDGKAGEKITLDTLPNNEPQTFPLREGFRGKVLNVNLAEWDRSGAQDVVGVDNIRLKARRSPEFYKTVHPMLNVGAMMQYDRGQGGIVLCNVLFKENESVADNRTKKRNILATILRNLKAPFAGGETVIAGADLNYTPIDLSKFATAFRDERGWFGDKQRSFRDLPTGRQRLAGVPFEIYDFKTSPVPTVVILQGDGVPGQLPDAVTGISVNSKASALFFLHTARIDQRMTDRDKRDNKRYELARYIVHYADGQAVEVPVHAEIDIGDYRAKQIQAIPGAQIAWVGEYPAGEHAVAYSMQWNNPRPDVAISHIDFTYGKDRRGVPALIAITAASPK